MGLTAEIVESPGLLVTASEWAELPSVLDISDIGLYLTVIPIETPVLNVDTYYYTTNFQLRYDGNDFFVRTWYDKSGNGNDAVQTVNAKQPYWYKNKVVFDYYRDTYLEVQHAASIEMLTSDLSIAWFGDDPGEFTVNKGANLHNQYLVTKLFGAMGGRYHSTVVDYNPLDGLDPAIESGFYAAIFDRDTEYLTINNDDQNSMVFNSETSVGDGSDFFIGRWAGTFDPSMDGDISYLCLHKKAYSTADITNLRTIFDGLPNKYVEHDFTYFSSIDNIYNLYGKYAFRDDQTNMPIVVLMHGYSQDADAFTDIVMRTMADYGFFVLSVGMRGRNDASGVLDASGRELYDIYDAVQFVINNINEIDSTRIAIVGYSGGGGNALNMCCKFPDLFNVSVSCYGMSDYGYSDTDSWWATNAYDGDGVFGAPRAAHLDDYRTRNTVEAITNYLGYLYMYHDTGDADVDVVHSQNIDAVPPANYEYHESNDGTYQHTIPQDVKWVRLTAKDYFQRVRDESEKIAPISGSFRVLGYIKTKRFELWLNTGLDAVVDLTYDVSADSYTLDPLTAGNIDVSIVQGNKSANQTINALTTIIVT